MIGVRNGQVSSVVKHNVIGAEGLEFDFRARELHTASPTARHRRFFQTVLPRRYAAKMGPGTRYLASA